MHDPAQVATLTRRCIVAGSYLRRGCVGGCCGVWRCRRVMKTANALALYQRGRRRQREARSRRRPLRRRPGCALHLWAPLPQVLCPHDRLTKTVLSSDSPRRDDPRHALTQGSTAVPWIARSRACQIKCPARKGGKGFGTTPSATRSPAHAPPCLQCAYTCVHEWCGPPGRAAT